MNFIKKAIPVSIFILIGLQISKDINLFIDTAGNINFFILLLSFPVAVTIYPEAAFAWFKLISSLTGQKIDRNLSIKAWILSNTGRYIPGSIWQYIGRAKLSEKFLKINSSTTTKSIYIELMLTIIAALTFSILALTSITNIDIDSSYYLLSLLLAMLALNPRVLNFGEKIISKITKKRISTNSVSYKKTLSLYPYFLANFLLNGLVLFMVTNAISPSIKVGVLQSTYYFSISWLLGFVSIFAPGGLGVTDLALILIYSNFTTSHTAALIALSYRLILTISELTVFIFFLKYKKNE